MGIYIKGDDTIRMIDLFGFEFDRSWEECNPEWHPYVFRNGVYQMDGSKGCETGLIVLGKEGELRRRCGSLREYLSEWPDIEPLGPVDDPISFKNRV